MNKNVRSGIEASSRKIKSNKTLIQKGQNAMAEPLCSTRAGCFKQTVKVHALPRTQASCFYASFSCSQIKLKNARKNAKRQWAEAPKCLVARRFFFPAVFLFDSSIFLCNKIRYFVSYTKDACGGGRYMLLRGCFTLSEVSACHPNGNFAWVYNIFKILKKFV